MFYPQFGYFLAFLVLFLQNTNSVEASLLTKCSSDFIGQFLQHANELRRHHGVPPLRYSTPISFWAQDWADHIVETEIYRPRPDNMYGENLYYFRSDTGSGKSHPNGGAVIQSWYDERENYHWFGEEPPPEAMEQYEEWGRFAQLVWKDSRWVGVGCAVKGEYFFVVADFDPEGNLVGQYTDEVMEAGSG